MIRRLFFGMTTGLESDRPRSHLVRGVIALATGSALLAGTTAQAAALLLATGGVFGSVNQKSAVCYAFNAGTTSVLGVSVVIHDQFGAVAGKVTTPSLAANETLPLGVTIANEAYSCTVTSTASNAVNLRGCWIFEIPAATC